jgi:PhnB protein
MSESTASKTGITGDHTTAGVPNGSTSLTPFLVVARAAEAIEFYRAVLGARLVDATEMGGVVVHAELDLGDGRLQLGEPNREYGLIPAPGGDVDAVVARATEAGATIREPATDFVSGDRFASIRDPFGVRWSIMSRVEDLSEEDSARRVADWAAQAASGRS